LVHYSRYWTRLQSRDQELKFLKSRMAVAAILKIAFLAITHRPIVRFQRNFVWESRTPCQQGLHDKIGKFLKSKMADGRHFENRWITISQWKYCPILTTFGVLQQILNLMRFWKALSQYLRCDKPGRWTDFDMQYTNRRVFTQSSAFCGLENSSFTSLPSKPQKTILGYIQIHIRITS